MGKKTSTRYIFKRIIYSFIIVSFLLSGVNFFLFFYLNKLENNNFEHPKKGFCSKIINVTAAESKITFNFNKKVTQKYVDFLKEDVFYETQAFGKFLRFKPSLIRIQSFNSSSITIDYEYPFIQFYEGNMLCFDEKKPIPQNEEKSIKHLAQRVFPLNINCKEFQENVKRTQMKCYGVTIQSRFCETRNLIHYNKMLLFYSDIDYTFPVPFMSMSSWPIPTDIKESRLQNQPIVVNENPLGENPSVVKGISYYFSRAINIGMLWHTLLETIAPLYKTIKIIEGDVEGGDRHIFYKDTYLKNVYIIFYKIFTDYEIVHLGETPKDFMFERCILGLSKFHPKSALLREKDTSFDFVYDPKDIEMPKYRNKILKYLGETTDIPDRKHPNVIIPLRKSAARSIVNFNETKEVLESICDFCNFSYVYLEKLSIEDQIRSISKATVILGVHGSALAHELWMHPSEGSYKSYLVEILPHGYWCRPWYKNVADSIPIDYYGIYGEKVDSNEKLDKCSERLETCIMPICHDILRDQRMFLPNERIGKVWRKIVNEMRKNAE